MRLNFDNDVKLSLNRFSRLGIWYVLALSVVALVAILGQVLIQLHLNSQLSDSRVVNVAGKQRMLSQKISKMVLMLRDNQTQQERHELLINLQSSVNLWKVSHEGLIHGNDSLQLPGKNSAIISSMFAKVSSDFENINGSTQQLLALLKANPLVSYDSLGPEVVKILEHEPRFLDGMEKIVLQYASEAQAKVSSLSFIEYLFLCVSLLVITLEIFFVFRPTAKQVNTTVNKLIDSEKNAIKLSKEIGELYGSLEKSYEQISIVNQPTDNPRLFAKSDQGGNIKFVFDYFKELSGSQLGETAKRLCDLFQGMENPDDWMDEVIEKTSVGNSWQGEIVFADEKGEDRWLEVTLVPTFNVQNEVDGLLAIGANITHRKSAELTMNKKNRAAIERKINQQKFRSVLILEGQEEERKRIAMDVHDGIGQMLTSLKFQIDSIDVNERERAEQKIREADQLIKQVIREVRRITFNLNPTVLGDYGLQAALNVFVQERGKLTDIKLVFIKEGEIESLSPKIENNIFRIVQEAINNAIKYSGASTIEVMLSELNNNLIVKVTDDGKGFDTKSVESRSMNIESGRGFFNMHERTEYVNGKLEINSEPDKGTSVVLTVPVRAGAMAE
jgi:two-component system, NarL family, sensor histidine kinase DegS